jgi:hypothetical protein
LGVPLGSGHSTVAKVEFERVTIGHMLSNPRTAGRKENFAVTQQRSGDFVRMNDHVQLAHNAILTSVLRQ